MTNQMRNLIHLLAYYKEEEDAKEKKKILAVIQSQYNLDKCGYIIRNLMGGAFLAELSIYSTTIRCSGHSS